jgi:hypothetical protein
MLHSAASRARAIPLGRAVAQPCSRMSL